MSLNPTWLIDCDNTLYPAGNRLFDNVNALIIEYMRELVGIPEDEVEPLRLGYWKRYGVTLGGLMADFNVDPEHYLSYVHNVPLSDYLSPDPALSEALHSLPGRKVIFTNATQEHARGVIDVLGMSGAVEKIYDIRDFNYIPKPKLYAYERVLAGEGVSADRCWFVEDSEENLSTGKELGMTTILVGGSPATGHHHIGRVHELPALYARLRAEEPS
ncbi:MAG: pyrimidine 5'-nucleotidase [Deltaproteobacteria bacterium]|nr:MAG: pyrimidine 5'-nucleotidase [Deltaproteobacteria bacterium]